MTHDRWGLTGPLGRRLLAAFVLVALSSVAVLTIAALVATDRGVASAQHAERQRVADRVADGAGRAYAGLEELRDGLRAPDVPRLTALHDQSLRLGRVVQDLADLSAAESAALSLRPVDSDLVEIARIAIAAQRPQLDAAGLRVEADLAPAAPVRVDPDRIHQALVDLLANAVRYCRPGDRVTVRVRLVDGTAHLTVADNGPGIPTDELPHVFDRLWRGRDAVAVAGTGIGLAVVRELVTAHGGTVTATSPRDGGTTITLRLPALDPRGRDSAGGPVMARPRDQ